MTRKNDKNKCLVQPSNSNMVCVVPKQNVEILGRALHALARIGDELYLEPVNGGLTFRTVHSNHSVYAEVHFTNQFFSYYNCPIQPQGRRTGDEDTDELKCRINMKSYLAAFRSLACVRKQVETCLLQIEPTWLMIKFRCHHGLIRTYKLPVIETESLQALYTVDEVPNHLVIGADVFAAAVRNFQLSERDITLAVEERTAVLRNYVPGGTDPAGVVRSELKLDAGEFISYAVGHHTAITFCLKAFRAVLFFSEPANLPLAVKFSNPGSPVVIISDSPTVELRFVLSSLAPEDCDTTRTDSQQLLTPIRSSEGREQQMRKQIQKPQINNCSLEEAWEGFGDANQPSNLEKRSDEINSRSNVPKSSVPQNLKSVSEESKKRQYHAEANSQQSATSSTRAVVGISPLTSSTKQNDANSFESSFHSKDANRGGQSNIVIPESDKEEDDEEDEDVVPASPPRPVVKKARFFFKKCFEPTLLSGDIEDDQIYVRDSDED